MTLGAILLCFYAAGLCWLAWEVRHAPRGREIPGVGFVAEDEMQAPFGDVVFPRHGGVDTTVGVYDHG